MSIYKSAVNKPITTALLFVAVIIFGLFSFSKLPIDLYPEMEMPAITVLTTYTGANSADIETNVTKKVETALSAVPNLKEITSTSQDNMSIVTIEFEWGSDLTEATNNIRDRLDRIMDDLPDGCTRPAIYKFNTTMMPILMYSITANESYKGLQKQIDEQVVNPLNRINGIGTISLSGGPERTIYVNADPQKLDAYNLTIEQIGNAIKAENLNVPAGSVRMGKEDYQLRIEGEFKQSDLMNNIVVGNYNGKSIFLRDVAVLNDTLKDVALESKVNGQQSMFFYVTKQSGANTVKVAQDVKKQINEIKKSLPKDIQFHEVFDSSVFIQHSISGLSEAFYYALLFVVFVILFFLGRWRATFIVVLTIPVSLIVAFIYLQMTGGSLNVISLSSLSIAIGMVVDDAIVVLENITKHIERGSSPREAAIYATNEVWLSVIVSSMVVIAVFLPLTMVGGQMGILFKQLGFIVSLTITVSTVAAISLTPMLSAKLLKLRANTEKKNWHQKHIVSMLDKMDDKYGKLLHWCLNHKKIVIASAAGIFLASLLLMFGIGTGNIPEADQGSMTAMVEVQRGTRVEEASKTARAIEADLKKAFGNKMEYVATSAGADDKGGFDAIFNTTGTNIINFSVKVVSKTERKETIEQMGDKFRDILDKYPEVINYTVTPNGGMMSMDQSNTVDVEIYGYDFNTTNALAQEIKTKISTIQGARDIQINRKDDKAELQIDFDREKLAQLGLNSATVSNCVRNRVAGLTASEFREDGDEYDIIVRYDEAGRNSISALEDITFMTPAGKEVKLKEVGKVKELWLPPNISHKRKERMVKVSVKFGSQDLGSLATAIKEKLKTVKTPPDVLISVGGAYEDQQESFSDIGLLILLSLMLVFIVMASQFESFTKPFVIMFSIPFAFSGVMLALFITRSQLDVIAALGAVMLIGIVVKNGIVLVDFINLMRDRDLELHEAIAVSGRSRLRPVLMTTCTTILGMLPMALSTSEGSEIWKPMAIAVIGGLTFSTLVTLLIVPTMYAVFARHGERDKQKKVREQFKNLNS
jgi:HAE1 family hydrophobic/amphiphilic exporter-1